MRSVLVGTIVCVVLLTVAVPTHAARPPAFHHPSSNLNGLYTTYKSSVDGFPLSYYEYLPTGFDKRHSYPLIVFLHGQQGTNGAVQRGGITSDFVPGLNVSGADGVTQRALLNETRSNGFIFIAVDSRSGGGWYINSPCGGPQQTDLMDAIANEESLRSISAVYLLGMSMGTEGVLYTAAQHPGMFAGLAIVAPVTDLYEDVAYREHLVKTANASDPWAYQSIYIKEHNWCGVGPGTGNSSQLAVDRMLENMTPLRFDEDAFEGVPIYATAGGFDSRAPDNTSIWSYANVNDTFVTSTCDNVTAYKEPANCTTTLGALHNFSPKNWTFRFVYEWAGAHDISQLHPDDLIAFWLGRVAGGYYLSNPGNSPIVANPSLIYR